MSDESEEDVCQISDELGGRVEGMHGAWRTCRRDAWGMEGHTRAYACTTLLRTLK